MRDQANIKLPTDFLFGPQTILFRIPLVFAEVCHSFILFTLLLLLAYIIIPVSENISSCQANSGAGYPRVELEFGFPARISVRVPTAHDL